ncbi:thiol-disulfide oxidoreductase DCC family protein [Lyngbya confervoides]|uniref:DCC1-like thiol-disulfide oxidoreductase family protein n=1 Tax=Lyngbya confervoides BDU141951 TaxID=1574623 RepID=A0ABD4T1C2_9CYAN|nr:DCC1-like thiol-disulfide oxidoreductase family protein [Lyngbya confervoides]MCM1982566.1 DCC1-like thiol-disulfide oxidoreductase family protein [Lyngbya confervoides BDU141951]
MRSTQIPHPGSHPADQVSQVRPSLPSGHRPIVFFDGECVMCNGFVDLMLRLDPQAKILLAPLQGKTAQQYLPPQPSNQREWTLYYLTTEGLFDRSEAVLRICGDLDHWMRLFSVFRVIPLPLRDSLYRFVAQHRYDWFGKRDSCRRPTPEDQAHFLP